MINCKSNKFLEKSDGQTGLKAFSFLFFKKISFSIPPKKMYCIFKQEVCKYSTSSAEQ